jgi:hypothetical protein
MMRHALVLLLLAASISTTWAEEPVAPKLDAPGAPAAAADLTPARQLPSMLTICVDRSVHECWTSASTTDCHEPSHSHGEVFATVAATGDSGASLRNCWDSLR